MTDVKNAKSTSAVLSVCATTSARLKDLVIKDGQLIFVQDKGRIALDFKGKRVFYNQITEVATEQERIDMASPAYGHYFVIETAVLWFYDAEWVQLTTSPQEVLFIGTELPELGKKKMLYVDSKNKEISIWDDESASYVVVADKTNDITVEDINKLFNNQ